MATEDQTAEEAERIATSDNDGDESGRLCDAFLDRFSGMMSHSSVEKMLKEQARMLQVLEVANEKLSSLNLISEQNFLYQAAEFRQNTRILIAMKRELDSTFRRIRSLKMRLSAQYPEAYAAAEAQFRVDIDDDG